jgi:hypothetical protein
MRRAGLAHGLSLDEHLDGDGLAGRDPKDVFNKDGLDWRRNWELVIPFFAFPEVADEPKVRVS